MCDFSGGMLIDDAMRKFIQGFRLPGEAQQIDRLLECFSRQYCENNPAMFEHPDVAYVLAFSVIMLNTDLHNRNIANQKKMSLVQYNRSLEGINQGKNLDAEMIEQLYNRIKVDEIKVGQRRTSAASGRQVCVCRGAGSKCSQCMCKSLVH
jgi:brefeldin A-inhibited guanine nucleotide-exchange protein